MTIFYPDVSNHEGAMTLEAGTVAVCAKASEGTGYADPFFAHYRAEAQRVGAMFFGYHFLHAGNAAAQAQFCFRQTGPGVNIMIDHEPTAGSNPTIADALGFAAEYRALGGLVTLDYLPPWYWKNLGSPSLAPLTAAGISLVSSDYTTYSDTGPGWSAYGAGQPQAQVWQYTDRLAYAGQSVDFNAYRGTIEQLKALLGYIEGGAMQWSDTIKGIGGRPNGNQVDYILTDISRMRDALFGDTTVSIPAGSPLAQLFAFLKGATTELTQVAGIAQEVKALEVPAIDYTQLVAAMAANPGFTQAVADAVVARIGADLK